jgi:hypothetical protein
MSDEVLVDMDMDVDHPLSISYKVLLETIEEMNPLSLMTETKNELQGYKDCIDLGPNNDRTAPENLSGRDDFYRWSKWHTCTVCLKEKAWTLAQFKEAALRKYVTIANRYIENLIASRNDPL